MSVASVPRVPGVAHHRTLLASAPVSIFYAFLSEYYVAGLGGSIK